MKFLTIAFSIGTLALASCGGTTDTHKASQPGIVVHTVNEGHLACDAAQHAKHWPFASKQGEFVSPSGQVILECPKSPFH